MTTSNESANVVLTADVDGYSKNINQANADTNKLIKTVTTLSDKLTALGKMGSRGVTILGVGSLAGIAAATKQAADFEHQMSVLKATATTTGPAFSKLENSVNSLSRQFPIARTEAIALVQQLTTLGVKGSSQIETLSSTMVRLSAATGESLGGLTQGFVELSRSMGNATSGNLPKFANVLYSVSKNAGVSASSVLSFAQAISPMARAAGIGETAILGISTAFSKAGADGFAGANTMNTILSDITRSIQYGSPNLTKYSDLIGVTAAQFKKMDSAEAFVKIVDAVNKQGPSAIKTLDSLGLDGIRAAKAFTALSQQSGGLQKAMTDARKAMGGDDLNKSSSNAMAGLSNSLTLIRNNLQQIGTSIGAGMLAPMELVATIGVKLTGTFANMAHALEPIGAVLTPIAAIAATIASSFGAIAGPIATLAGARMLMGTNMGASFRGGLMAGRSGANAGTAIANLAADDPRRIAFDKQANGTLSFMSRNAMLLGQGIGRLKPYGTGPGAGSPLGILPNALAGVVRWNTQMYDSSRLKAFDQQRSASGGPNVDRIAAAARSGWAAGSGGNGGTIDRLKGGASSVGEVFKQMSLQGTTFAGSLRNVQNAVVELGVAMVKAAGSTIGFVASSGTSKLLDKLPDPVSTGLRGAAKGIKGAASAVGPGLKSLGSNALELAMNPAVMIGGTIAMAAWQNEQSIKEKSKQTSTNTVGIDAYTEKLGVATTALSSFATAIHDAEASLPKPDTIKDALTITPDKINAAMAPGRKLTDPTISKLSTPSEQAAYLKTFGNNPQQAQAALLDIIQIRKGGAGAQKVVDEYFKTSSGSVGIAKSTGKLLTTASKQNESDKGWWEKTRGFFDLTNDTSSKAKDILKIAERGILNQNYKVGASSAENTQREMPGIKALLGKAYNPNVSDEIRTQALKLLSQEGIKLPKLNQEGKLAWVNDAGKGVNTIRPTLGMNDQERGQWLMQNFMYTSQLKGYKDMGVKIGLSGAANDKYASTLTNPEDTPVFKDFKKYSAGTPDLYGQLMRSTNAVKEAPGNGVVANEQASAIAQTAIKALQAGQDFASVSVNLSEVAGRIKSSDPAFAAVVESAKQMTAAFNSAKMSTMGRVEQRAATVSLGIAQMHSLDITGNTQAQGRATLEQAQADAGSEMKNFATSLRSFVVSLKRSQEDFDRSVFLQKRGFDLSKTRGEASFERSYGTDAVIAAGGTSKQSSPIAGYSRTEYNIARKQQNLSFEIQYGTEMLEKTGQKSDGTKRVGYNQIDYDKQKTRSKAAFDLQATYASEDHLKQVSNAWRDYNKSQERQQEDHDTQLARSKRDFYKSQERSLADFNKSQARAQVDFDKQMVRRAEAAARSIYDPFKRVTTQQTMDTSNLLLNLKRQTKMIEDQKKNLDTLLRSGVNQSVIDTLNLSDSSQAQQLARMVSDLRTSPNLASDLNAQVATRQTATTNLVNSNTNVDYRQTQQDFALSMSRSTEDFATSVDRVTKDFQTSLNDNEFEFTKSIKRQYEDFTKQLSDGEYQYGLSITRNQAAFDLAQEYMLADFDSNNQRIIDGYILQLEQSEAAQKRSLNQAIKEFKIAANLAADDQKTILSDMRKSYNIQIDRMKTDFINAYKDLNGDIASLSKTAIDLMTTAGIGQSKVLLGWISSVKTAWDGLSTLIPKDWKPGDPIIIPRPVTGGVGTGGSGSTFSSGPTGTGHVGWDGQWKTYKDGSVHGGADYQVGIGTPVYATRNAKVVAVENLSGSYGKYVKLSDGSNDFFYAHLSSQLVRAGQNVTRGQEIGLSGNTGNSTGAHLHYEVRPAGATSPAQALDPAKFLALGGIVTGPTRAVIGEGGHSEAVIPLNNQGSAFMANTIKEALASAYATPIRGMSSGCNHGGGTTQYDHSANFNGEVTVVAQDPNDMARKLEQKARMQRLIRPGSSR